MEMQSIGPPVYRGGRSGATIRRPKIREFESPAQAPRYTLPEVTMNRYLPPVLIALCAALGVVLAAQRSALNTAQHELEQVQARVDKLEAKQKESAARKAVDELQEQVARAERKAAAAAGAAEAA